MAEFRMPSLGADMEAGVLVEWLKKPGERVARGDVIAVVETQKGAIEIEVFQAGTIDALLAQPGQKLAVGAAMAIIRADGEEPVPREAVPAMPAVVAPSPPAVPLARPGLEGRASPAARRRAAELGVSLGGIAGTGPGGAISLADVEAAAPAAPSFAGMREVIGAAMARSKREIPHYYLGHTVDLETALRWLETENLKRSVAERILFGALLLKAVALALRTYPEFNGFHVEGKFKPSEGIHVGVAISLRQGGLIAPAIHDADRLSLPGLMASLRDLVRRARCGGLRSSELSDPTITATSLGEQGTDIVFPVIYPPQVAIVGFGAIARRPWVTDSGIEARRIIFLSLAADHRVSDGHRGGRFLRAVAERLQEPQAL